MVKIKGIVNIERACEISAMPAGTEVSFPYAAGITTVFKPSGIESEHTRQTNSSLVIKLPIILTFSFNKNTSPAITSGYAIKRKKVTR